MNEIINFTEEKAVIIIDGLEIVLEKERAINIAKQILSWYDEGENDE